MFYKKRIEKLEKQIEDMEKRLQKVERVIRDEINDTKMEVISRYGQWEYKYTNRGGARELLTLILNHLGLEYQPGRLQEAKLTIKEKKKDDKKTKTN